MLRVFISLLVALPFVNGTAVFAAQDNDPFGSPPSTSVQDDDPFASPLGTEESESNKLEVQVRNHLPADLFVHVKAWISELQTLRYENGSNLEAVNDFSVWMAQALESTENPDLQKWALARLKNKPSLCQHPRLQAALILLTEQPATPMSKTATEILSQFHDDFRNVAPRPATNIARWPIYSASGPSGEQKLLEKIDEQYMFGRFFDLEFLKDRIAHEYQIPFVLEFDVAKTDLFETVDLESDQVISLRAIMELTLPKFGLTFQIRDELLVITTVEQAAKNPVRRVYQIAPESDSTIATTLAEKLLATFPGSDLQVIPNNHRILVIGSEQQHFEVSKLLTMLLGKE